MAKLVDGRKRGRPGKWLVDYRENGRRRWATFDRKEQAEDYLAKVIPASRQRTGQPLVDPTITVADYAKRWLERHDVSARTREEYEKVYRNHIAPAFGAFQVRGVTRPHVKEFVQQRLASGSARSTVRLDLATLRVLLSAAVEDQVIPANPAAGRFKGLRLEQKAGALQDEIESKAFDAEQLTRLLAGARRSTESYIQRLYPSFLLGARTGARLSEIIGLRWQDLDLDAGHVTFREKISKRRRGVLKSGYGRVVDLSPDLVEALRRVEVDRKAEALQKGWAAVPEHVFVTERGGPYDDNRWRKAFHRCAKTAKLAGHFTPHSLRHSFASLLLQDGASVEHVSRLLGHADIGLTCRTYGRWLRPNTKGTVARLDSIAPVAPPLSKVAARSRTLGARGSRAVATAS